MELHITKRMFGEDLGKIGNDSDSVKTILEEIFNWKNDPRNMSKYKIEKYDRIIFNKDSIAIDFGDYSTFILIKGVSEEQKAQFRDL